MMVLPVQHLPSGGGGKGGKKKKGKKGKRENAQGDVQVNLVVDPGMFGRDRHSCSSSDVSDDDTWGVSQHQHKRRRRAPRRRSVFAGLAMEEQWRAARAALRHLLFFDIGALLVWAAEFVYIMMGKRCPTNEYDGWYVAFLQSLRYFN
jgi:hypothetical protein